jgi:ribosomal protein S27E
MLITTPCPQCGGEIGFSEEANAIKCDFCASILQMVGTEGVRRYYLEPKTDEEKIKKALARGFYKKKRIKIRFSDSRLIFYPYWWVKGMVFKWVLGKKTIPSKVSGIPDTWENVKELKTRLLDHSFPANSDTLLGPYSLGIRTKTLRFRAFNRKEMEKWGSPLKRTVTHKHAVAHAEELKETALKARAVDVEMKKVGLIGEHYALVYFPIWAFSISSPRGDFELLVDGISHSVIRTPKKAKEPLLATLGKDSFGFEQGDLGFIPFRCPVCGWDLPFHPYNIVHRCNTCGRAWREKGGSYREVAYRVIKGKGDRKEETTYLPFWTFTVSLVTSQVRIATLEEFYQYFPLPRLIEPEKQKRRLKFYVPAFQIKNIPAVNKFSTLFTHNQPKSDYAPKDMMLDHEAGDVFLSLKEAKEMSEILLFSLIPKNSRKAKKFVSQAKIHFSHEHLEWHPFFEKGIYFREENTGFALQKGALEIR